MTCPAKRKGDVAPANYLVFGFIDGGVPGDRNVSFIVAAKEVTESCTSTVGALAFNQIKPSGTLGYRIVKRLFDLVFSLMAIAILLALLDQN